MSDINNKYCTKCNLHSLVKHPRLMGRGSDTPDILVLNTHPIVDESTSGNQWISRAEKLVEACINNSGLSGYYTYAIKCTPFGYKKIKVKKGEAKKKVDPSIPQQKIVKEHTPTESNCCKVFTIELIQKLKPKVVLCLGTPAMAHIMGFTLDPRTARNKAYYHPELNCHVIVTWDTTSLLRSQLPHEEKQYEKRYLSDFLDDLKIAHSLITKPQPRKIKAKPVHLSEAFDIIQYFNKLKASEAFSFDIETSGTDPLKDIITAITFSCDLGVGVHILWKDAIEHLELLGEVLLSPAKKIAHNGAFDISFLRAVGLRINNWHFDTMLAFHVISMSYEGAAAKTLFKLKFMAWFMTTDGGYEAMLPGGIVAAQKSRGKKVVAEDGTTKKKTKKGAVEEVVVDPVVNLYDMELDGYANYIFNKKLEKLTATGMEPIPYYSAMDSDVTLRIYHYLKSEIDSLYGFVFNELVMPLNTVLMKMTEHGFLLDVEYMKQVKEENLELIEGIKKEFFTAIGYEFNLDSPSQLGEFIYKKLKIKPHKDFLTPSGAPSTDVDAINFFSEQHPMLLPIVAYRNLQKEIKTYVDGFIEKMDSNNRIHPGFMQATTATGRLSCIAAGTKISCFPTDVNIEDINPGQVIFNYDNEGHLKMDTVIEKSYSGYGDCVRVIWENTKDNVKGELICTPEHKLKNIHKEWVEAQRLKVGDIIRHLPHTESNRTLPITDLIDFHYKIVSVTPEAKYHVWDLWIKKDHNFIANKLNVKNSTGPNLQNIPRKNKIRNMFIAPPGHKIVSADLSQAELRVLAMLANDPAMIAAFESGQDFHTMTACGMFGIAMEDFNKELKEHSEARTAAKCIHLDSRVPTSLGIMRIGDMIQDYPEEDEFKHFDYKVEVINPDGNWTRAKSFFNGGLVYGNHIITKNGFTIKGSDDHEILTVRPDNSFEMKALGDIKTGDSIAFQGNIPEISPLALESIIFSFMNILSFRDTSQSDYILDLLMYVSLFGTIDKEKNILKFKSMNSDVSIISTLDDLSIPYIKDGTQIWVKNIELINELSKLNFQDKTSIHDIMWKFTKERASHFITEVVYEFNTNKDKLTIEVPFAKDFQLYLFMYSGVISNRKEHTISMDVVSVSELLVDINRAIDERPILKHLKANSKYAFAAVSSELMYYVDTVKDKMSEEMFVVDLFIPDGNRFNACGIPMRNCINFGVVYQMQARTLVADMLKKYNIVLTLEQAENFINKFYRTYPQVAQWIKDTKAFAREHGYVETLYGRRRYLPEAKSSNRFTIESAYRRSVNTKVQSPASDAACFGLVRLQEYIENNNLKSHIIGVIHDDILVEAPDDEVELIKEKLVYFMTKDLPKITVTLVADPTVVQVWKK